MKSLLKLIGGYGDRNKWMRFCQYVLKFLAGSRQTRLSIRLGTIADEFGNCRAVLRLFDDIPMLASNLHYGFGKGEPNTWLRILQLINNLANQLYYPLEHFAWLGKKQIADVQPYTLAVASIGAWATALVCEILKAISRVCMIRNAQKRLLKEQKLDVRNESEPSEMSNDIRSQIRSLKAQERDNYLAFIEHSSDFINAVNWLPPGVLWSGKFSPKFVGAMGTISSVIKLYRLHSAPR